MTSGVLVAEEVYKLALDQMYLLGSAYLNKLEPNIEIVRSGDWNEFNRKCTHTHTVDRIWPAGLHQSSRQTSIVCGGSGDIFRDDNKITNHMTGHM